MVQQLRDSCTGAAVYAASVLTNMASQEELRRSILAHEAMPALVELLHSTDNSTLISAMQAVASLACDAEARLEVKDSISKVYTIATVYKLSVEKNKLFLGVRGVKDVNGYCSTLHYVQFLVIVCLFFFTCS